MRWNWYYGLYDFWVVKCFWLLVIPHFIIEMGKEENVGCIDRHSFDHFGWLLVYCYRLWDANLHFILRCTSSIFWRISTWYKSTFIWLLSGKMYVSFERRACEYWFIVTCYGAICILYWDKRNPERIFKPYLSEDSFFRIDTYLTIIAKCTIYSSLLQACK